MENIQEAHRLLADFDPLDAKLELFRRGNFGFLTDQDGVRHEKQHTAFQYLTDDETEEFMYGGAAGGGKSWIGSTWLGFSALMYPGTNWFMGRKELKRITESTLQTFFKVAKEYGFSDRFKFNAQKNYIKLDNGSKIDLLELKYMPSDPYYERFGSTEYTGGWIEEAPECNFGAFDVLNTRVGRHLNDKFNVRGKIFLTANPNKNWAKKEFYDLHRKGELGKVRKFLQCLVTENPFIESGYIERLKRTKDSAKRARLLEGDWDYADDGDTLVDYDDIQLAHSNDHVTDNEMYLTCDAARFGSDKAVILVWRGWAVIDYKTYETSSTTEIQDMIDFLRYKYDIPRENCIVDQDGVGGGIQDNCEIMGFVNNAKPFVEDAGEGVVQPKYNNLQTQCGYYLAKKFREYEIWLAAEFSPQEREEIDEEIAQLKSWKADDDNKVYLKPKKLIKPDIGRSPDWRDALLMRSFFDLSGGMTSMETYWS